MKNEVHRWLEEELLLLTVTQGSWVWCVRPSIGMHSDDVVNLRKAGFKLSTKRNQYFHVSTKFLPGEMAEGLHSEPIPFPVGYVKRKPGPKKGSKQAAEAHDARVVLTMLLTSAPD